MTALEEIKEVATSSARVAERAALSIPREAPASDKALREFRDALVDMRADLVALHKIAVLQARRSDSSQEIADIWREVLVFCGLMLPAWQVFRGFEPVTQGLIDDYRKYLEQLKAAALEHFQFHNGFE